ncbi:MAG: AAA family ATPase [Rhodothermia bacterium]|nr:AAA family ATPase [Rhodothermia bacterium]
MTQVPAEKLLDFLADPASYAHGPSSVEIIQTHISYVAIASPYVYKVKKPVDLGFLDFSTLDKRRYYCEEEVRLNRRLCSSIYDEVVALHFDEGVLSFAPKGDIVDYAVRMRQLRDGYFMNQLLEADQLGRDHFDRLIKRLVSFYSSQSPSEEVTAWGQIDKIRLSTDENFEQTAGHVGAFLTRPAYGAIRFFTQRFFEKNRDLFARRRAEGRIVDGHGDLHLEHVHMEGDDICIYDCIEFSERLRFIDVANDVGFLAMDLDYYERPSFSDYFVRGIGDAMDDKDLLRLLPFYKCYRAYVRGKVEGMRALEGEVPESERTESRKRARRYYRLALNYCVSGNDPLVVVVMGRVGTGKSTLARMLGDALGWLVISSDRKRKELAGINMYERGDEVARAKLYSEEMTRKTYDGLLKHAVERGRDHHSTILDATYSVPAERAAAVEMLNREGIAHRFVEVTAPDAVIRSRLADREQAADVVSDARLDDFPALSKRYVSPHHDEPLVLTSVSSNQPIEKTATEVLEELVRLNE